MDNLNKALNSLSISQPFRDVIISIGGLTFLILLRLIFNVDFFQKISIENFGRIENDFAFLVSGFVIGKILFFIADLFIIIFNTVIGLIVKIFLSDISLKDTLKNFCCLRYSWKKSMKTSLGYTNPLSGITYNELKNHISALEISKALKDYPSIENELERSVYYGMFLRLCFSITLLIGLFSSVYVLYWLSASVLFFCMYLKISRDIKGIKMSIYRGVMKELGKEKEEKLNMNKNY